MAPYESTAAEEIGTTSMSPIDGFRPTLPETEDIHEL
jgi:hypothetical protein